MTVLQVETVKAGAKPAWQSIDSFMGGDARAQSGAGPMEVVTAIRLPPIRSSERFWSFKVSTSLPHVIHHATSGAGCLPGCGVASLCVGQLPTAGASTGCWVVSPFAV